MVAHAQRLAGGGQLADAVLAQAVLAVGGQVLQLGDEDLALLAQRARDEGDGDALGGVLRHRRAGADRLVVRVRVDQQQPARAVQRRHVDRLGGGVDGGGGLGEHRLLGVERDALAGLGRGQGRVGHDVDPRRAPGSRARCSGTLAPVPVASLTRRVGSLARLMVATVAATAVVSAVVLVLLVVWLVPQTERYTEAARSVRLAHLSMVDQETSLRGFLGTGQPLFLEPYRRGSPRAAGPQRRGARARRRRPRADDGLPRGRGAAAGVDRRVGRPRAGGRPGRHRPGGLPARGQAAVRRLPPRGVRGRAARRRAPRGVAGPPAGPAQRRARHRGAAGAGSGRGGGAAVPPAARRRGHARRGTRRDHRPHRLGRPRRAHRRRRARPSCGRSARASTRWPVRSASRARRRPSARASSSRPGARRRRRRPPSRRSWRRCRTRSAPR